MLKMLLLKLAWMKTSDGSRILQFEDVQRAFAQSGEEGSAWAFWQAASSGRLRLLDSGEGVVQFLHLRLQEFLASEYLWAMGDCQALRCVSGAGQRGQAADEGRYAGTRRLLVELLRDGATRSSPPDSDAARHEAKRAMNAYVSFN